MFVPYFLAQLQETAVDGFVLPQTESQVSRWDGDSPACFQGRGETFFLVVQQIGTKRVDLGGGVANTDDS